MPSEVTVRLDRSIALYLAATNPRERRRHLDAVLRTADPLIKHLAVKAIHGRTAEVDLDDIFQAARLGAIYALTKYDPARGKFVTYAANWIRHFVQEAQGSEGTIGRPRRYGVPPQALRAINRFRARFGRIPTLAELNADPYLQQHKIVVTARELDQYHRPPTGTSLDALVDPRGVGSKLPVSDAIADPSTPVDLSFAEREERALLASGIARLRPRERRVMEALVYDERSVQEVAAKEGITPECLRQTQLRARTRLAGLVNGGRR